MKLEQDDHPTHESATSELTFEDIVDNILAILQRAGILLQTPTTPWSAFPRLPDLVHENFQIPSTTPTPIMRRLLFALGYAARPRHVVGAGTYVGYTFSWLLRDRSDAESGPFFDSAVGIDMDDGASSLARRNCALLGHGDRLRFVSERAETAVSASGQPIDLLYLDLDDPTTGKAGYRDVLEVALPRLAPGALILAHDPCVAKFERDFAAYHSFQQESGMFADAMVLPVDACGLSVTSKRRSLS